MAMTQITDLRAMRTTFFANKIASEANGAKLKKIQMTENKI